ncbi:hypothetical protein ACIQM4_09455 [Streptomyces sp. NPDC091272]|uniref:hypothetical protein n=1 Tax=Streptomyces sp. NPDC091272 TaxID=3365981 RepID=UPI003821E582
MPRGRHRHSPPLHKLLPPSAVAGVSLVCAVGAWFVAEPVVLRVLVAATAASAVTGAALMRGWDRTAGRRVAELTRAREADVWKAEERVADVEGDLDESRALRSRLEEKLRSKRVELAALRNEHAALLRRYATAETERATALERRRQLALEAARKAPRELPAAGSTPTPAAYMRAAAALQNLGRNGAAQTAASAAELREHTRPATAVTPYAPRNLPAVRKQGGFDFFGTAAAEAAGVGVDAAATDTAASALEPVRGPGQHRPAPRQPDQQQPAVQQQSAEHVAEQHTVQQHAAVQNEDLADVVGEEALADHRTLRAADRDAVGEVIDLTAHDETEQLDVADLRSAIS